MQQRTIGTDLSRYSAQPRQTRRGIDRRTSGHETAPTLQTRPFPRVRS